MKAGILDVRSDFDFEEEKADFLESCTYSDRIFDNTLSIVLI